jgi:hypothetical protein
MFALINTKGATHIAIYIPTEGADKTIPALAGMLENNAVFLNKGYSAIEQCHPEMSIQLGSVINIESYDVQFTVTKPENATVLDESFVLATPETQISNAKGLERKDTEIRRLRAELECVKQDLAQAKDTLEGLYSL